MDFWFQSTSWSFGDIEVDVFAVCVEFDVLGDGPVSSTLQPNLSTICAEGLQEYTPGIAGARPSVVSSACTVQDRRCSSPSPTPTCIDPKLTILWPSPDPSSSADKTDAYSDRTAVDDDDDDWLEDLTRARVPDMPGTGGLQTSKTRKKARSAATAQATIRKTRAGDKGPDRSPTRWKCRVEGGDILSGSPTCISKVRSHADPGPTGRGEGRKTEGIERIHAKLWKCRMGGCNKTFHRKGDAVRHLQTTAKHNGKSVVCSCGALFSRHDALKRHQRLCTRHTRQLL